MLSEMFNKMVGLKETDHISHCSNNMSKQVNTSDQAYIGSIHWQEWMEMIMWMMQSSADMVKQPKVSAWY